MKKLLVDGSRQFYQFFNWTRRWLLFKLPDLGSIQLTFYLHSFVEWFYETFEVFRLTGINWDRDGWTNKLSSRSTQCLNVSSTMFSARDVHEKRLKTSRARIEFWHKISIHSLNHIKRFSCWSVESSRAEKRCLIEFSVCFLLLIRASVHFTSRSVVWCDFPTRISHMINFWFHDVSVGCAEALNSSKNSNSLHCVKWLK